jgi:hypothetical protein
MLQAGICQIADIINSQQKSTEKQALLSTCWRDNYVAGIINQQKL